MASISIRTNVLHSTDCCGYWKAGSILFKCSLWEWIFLLLGIYSLSIENFVKSQLLCIFSLFAILATTGTLGYSSIQQRFATSAKFESAEFSLTVSGNFCSCFLILSKQITHILMITTSSSLTSLYWEFFLCSSSISD